VDPAPAFRPTAALENLRRRAELLARVRSLLTAAGYWEVETPLLSADVCVDAHLDPFPVDDPALGRAYLQTSPEFGMKRLLAAGADAIFQITRSFRRDEIGVLHNPEFTIVEWYRVGGDYRALMREVSDLVSAATGWPAAEEITYRDAFRLHAGLDPATATNEGLVRRCAEFGFHAPVSPRDDLLNFLLAELVEPKLGAERPALLYDYPASQAALARTRQEPGFPVGERFELYFRGVELANGFQELTDSAELRRRNAEQNGIRRSRGMADLPAESRLLLAMDAGLPDSAGVALGFDRLVMLALGAKSIAEVIAFPWPRA
jgi:lysyl-tRNA synthetase class 2